MSDQQANHRKYYRLKYPASLMPTIYLGESEHAVPEISEGGLRIRCADLHALKIGQEVSGRIVFDDGVTLDVTGIVMRRDQDHLIIAPLQGLSYQRIVLEQRTVLRKTRREQDLFSVFTRRTKTGGQ